MHYRCVLGGKYFEVKDCVSIRAEEDPKEVTEGLHPHMVRILIWYEEYYSSRHLELGIADLAKLFPSQIDPSNAWYWPPAPPYWWRGRGWGKYWSPVKIVNPTLSSYPPYSFPCILSDMGNSLQRTTPVLKNWTTSKAVFKTGILLITCPGREEGGGGKEWGSKGG